MCFSAAEESKIMGRRLNSHQGFHPKRKTGITVTIMKCTKCGLIYSNPLPIPESIGQHYDIIPESYWENYTDDTDQFQSELCFSYFKKHHSFEPGMKMLDVGAGTGKIMKGFADMGFDVYGIEPSVPFFDAARRRMNLPEEKLLCTSIEGAKLPEEFFDYIHFTAVLEHVYDPNAAIKKVLTWLKKDGILQIDVPHSKWLMAKLLNLYYKITFSDYVTNLSPMHKPYHLYEFALQSFEANGKINDYSVEAGYYSAVERILPKHLRWVFKNLMTVTNTEMEISVWIKKF
jgi:2-polyprenyl-3-methyl-5-hydroxy-6-metoxy-1,4-benzoquinol methylase